MEVGDTSPFKVSYDISTDILPMALFIKIDKFFQTSAAQVELLFLNKNLPLKTLGDMSYLLKSLAGRDRSPHRSGTLLVLIPSWI